MQDLIEGILPVEASRVTGEEAWEIYKTMDEFANVVFKQFKERLRNHRKQVGENQIRAAKELDALEHDRGLFPGRQAINKASLYSISILPSFYFVLMLKQEISSE
jgi:hypothetical protein